MPRNPGRMGDFVSSRDGAVGGDRAVVRARRLWRGRLDARGHLRQSGRCLGQHSQHQHRCGARFHTAQRDQYAELARAWRRKLSGIGRLERRATCLGTQTVGPLQADTAFRLSCGSTGGGVQRQVKVTVAGNGPPSIAWPAGRRRWRQRVGAADVVRQRRDELLGGRRLAGATGDGQLRDGAPEQVRQYQLTCRGPGGTSLASVTVEMLDGCCAGRRRPGTQMAHA